MLGALVRAGGTLQELCVETGRQVLVALSKSGLTVYVDTSVLVAALTHESRTGEMQEWLAAQPVGGLAISDWVMTEFSAALSVKLRTG